MAAGIALLPTIRQLLADKPKGSTKRKGRVFCLFVALAQVRRHRQHAMHTEAHDARSDHVACKFAAIAPLRHAYCGAAGCPKQQSLKVTTTCRNIRSDACALTLQHNRSYDASDLRRPGTRRTGPWRLPGVSHCTAVHFDLITSQCLPHIYNHGTGSGCISLLSELTEPLSRPVRLVALPLADTPWTLLPPLLLWETVCMLSSKRCFCCHSHSSMRGAGRWSSGSHESSCPSVHLHGTPGHYQSSGKFLGAVSKIVLSTTCEHDSSLEVHFCVLQQLQMPLNCGARSQMASMPKHSAH